MAEDDDKGSKTQDATEKKLRNARQKGDVPISREAGHLAIYCGITALIAFVLPGWSPDLARALGAFFEMAAVTDIGSGQDGLLDIVSLILEPVKRLAQIAVIFLGLFFALAVLGGLAQGPVVVTVERVLPKLSKISPQSGIKRLLGVQNLVEFCKSLVKMLILGFVAMSIITSAIRAMLPGAGISPDILILRITEIAIRVMLWILALTIPVAIADFTWKRISHIRNQRMSIKELRDEFKESEGDPLIKAQRRKIGRKRRRVRLKKVVPQATLVITNPTHFAIALRYERGVDQAPICVAKGADLMARHIRLLAFDHDVPVIESKMLARVLYSVVEIDAPIPEVHWQAVAELVSFVLDMKHKVRRRLPDDAWLRTIDDEQG
jgi:flagellar biosynthetic protein FlhB